MTIFTTSYKSPIGILKIFSNGQAICYLGISEPKFTTKIIVDDDIPIFVAARRWLDTYFSGQKPEFTLPAEPKGTEFQKKVWSELLRIDFGQTATYGEIAKRIGCKSAQAIGQAVAKNPVLIIIPCHRIVASDGKTGGFSAGIERKIWLINNEKQSLEI